MDGDFTIWKRIILIAIGVIVAAGILAAVYTWYQIHSLNSHTLNISPSVQPVLTPSEQQNELKSFSAPPPAATSTNTASSNDSKTGSKSAIANTPAPQAPASFDAPAQAPPTAAETEQEQAEINAFSAPSK